MKTLILKQNIKNDFSDIIIEDILISNKFNMVHITYPKHKTIDYVKEKIKDNMDKDIVYGIFKKKSLFNEILNNEIEVFGVFGDTIKVSYSKENIFIIEDLDDEKFREYTSLFINAINTENIIQVNIYGIEYICNILEYEYWMNGRGRYNIKIKMIPYNKFKKE